VGSEAFWENLFGLVWSPATWAKIVLVLVTAPWWSPIVRTLWGEVQEVLAPEGGVYGTRTPRPIRRRPPGEDPFVKIPRPGYRPAPARRSGGAGELVPARRRGTLGGRTLRVPRSTARLRG
jgi:hypothetical protein